MEDRQFATGSMVAPDPFDHHLDQLGFYRKHTARDATCLFRVISEQMYGVQIYHQDVRDICVRYMGMHQSAYEDVVAGSDLTYDRYIAKVSKPTTFGTLKELTALAHRYERNVYLFEPCNMGDWYVLERDFKDTFLVFYTPPKHFDTVFTKQQIESIAFSQSLTYEILYSHVFKLPDVVYAVERMLHDPPQGTFVSQIEVSPFDETQETLTLSDGRHFILDHADETECILKNYLLCHFHNKQFDKMIALDDFSDAKKNDRDKLLLADQSIASSLPRKNVSCVRQLLDENIKPFSYKVAKALDTHIYRNIEFDVWNEARKCARYRKWAQGDSLQVGVKCLVKNIDQKRTSYYGHIQEMHPQKKSCDVFVETLGEYRTVPMSAIKAVPNVSWMLPARNGRYRPEKNRKRDNNYRPNEHTCKANKWSKVDDEAYLGIHYFTKTLHIPQQYCEYVAQPQYTSTRYSKNEETGAGNNNQPSNKNGGQAKKSNQGGGEKTMKTDNNTKNLQTKRSGGVVESKSGKTDTLKLEFEPHVHYGNQGGLGGYDTSNTVTFQHMDRGDMDGATMVPTYHAAQHQYTPLQSMIRDKELLRSIYPANLNAQPSLNADGSDLQRIDFATLRFFYNLGHEYLRYMYYRFPAKVVKSMFQGIIYDSYNSRPNRYAGGYYDNFHDMGELASTFNRSVSFAGRDQHTNKPNDGQNLYRRPMNVNTANAPKKNTNRYTNRFDYRNRRQYGDSDASKNQPQTYSKSTPEYTDTAPPVLDQNVRTPNENEPSLQHLIPTPQVYHDVGDPAFYGVPVGYGMYPHANDNFATYPVPVPGGMMFSEQLNVDSDLTQTYPYYNPQGTLWYSTPIPQQLPMAQPQTSWYQPSIVPMQSTMPLVSIASTTSTLSAAPSTSSYGTAYVAPDTDPETPAFTQNEL